jgi:hypothetical protein
MTNIRAADAERVFQCHASLLAYTNHQFNVVDGVADVADVRGSSPTQVQRLRDALYENPGLIRGFVWKNPANLDDDDRRMVASWRAFEQGRFLIRRFTSDYAEFLDLASPHRLFAVNSLHDSFKRMGVEPPQIVSGVLLPLRDRIVSDGHLHADAFGTETMTEGSEDEIEQARARYGLIKRLPAPKEPTEADFRAENGHPPVTSRQRLDECYREAIHGDVGAAYQLLAQYEQAHHAGHVDPETSAYEKHYYSRVTAGLDTIALLTGWSFIEELMSAYEPGATNSPAVAAVANVVAMYVLRTRQTSGVDAIPAEALEYLLACATAPEETRPWTESTAVGWGIDHPDVSITDAIHDALLQGNDTWAGEVLQHVFYADQHAATELVVELESDAHLPATTREIVAELPRSNAWPAGPTGSWWHEFGYRFDWDAERKKQVTELTK